MAATEATLISVLRHGAVAGRPHVFRGRLDDPLSEAGREAMARAVARLAPIECIATSPLVRCRAFAQDWAGQQNLPLTILDSMTELDFGAWEGLSPDEAARQDTQAHRAFLAGAGAPPGGESLADLRRRVWAGWTAWLADADGGHRLLVTHAGVMRALLMDIIGLDPARPYAIALPEAGHFQVSVLAGHAPILLNLNPCAA